MRALARIPIRVRLTLAFALVMAVVLVLAGVVVYVRTESALDRATDRSLRARAADIAALVRSRDSVLELSQPSSTSAGESFAQVVDSTGTVVDATPAIGERPLLSRAELPPPGGGAVVVERARLAGGDDPVRLLATPIEARGRPRVAVVGASLEPQAEAREALVTQLLLGGPLVLLLSSFAAYVLARRALAPVEAMRREADAVSLAEPGRRLPLPPAKDEIASLGATLNDMLARVEAGLERERRFVADASHELRTPLAALRTELELALRRERTPAELEAALRSASDETARLSRLAEDLLVLARVDAGRLAVRRERLRAREVLETVRDRYAWRAAAAARSLPEVAADGSIEISADRIRIEQALANLVENALSHGDGAILLAAERRNGRVALHVRDEGDGFADEFLPRAFDPFARADATRSSPGAGLGLAIVDAIAKAHGGRAGAANGGRGADVWLELPALQPSGSDSSPRSA